MPSSPHLRRLLCALLFGAAATPAIAQDTITLNQRTRRGTKVVGSIGKVTRTEVQIRSNGIDRQIPVNEIQRIGLGGEPAGLRQGRNAVFSGQYEQAQESLDAVTLDASASGVLRQELEFYRASAYAHLALRGSGDPKGAAKMMLSFLKRNRQSFHYYEAVRLVGQLASMSGSHDSAIRYFQELAKAPWPEFAIESAVLEGSAARAKGDYESAIAQFDKAIAQPANDAEASRQQTMARIGKAACMGEVGRTEEALAALREIIAKNDASDSQLFATAYLAQGAAYRQADQALDAVMAYLHVDLLFFNQRDAHAEALYYLSQLWPKVNNPDRGIQARKLLKTRYATTSWARMD